MRKAAIYLLFATFIAACGEDDDTIPQPPVPPVVACEEVECTHEDEFFGKAIMNGECWKTEWTLYLLDDSVLDISLGLPHSVGIGEMLTIRVNPDSDLNDTLWLSSPINIDPPANNAFTIYTYIETDAIAGHFQLPVDAPPTGEDYLLFDYINEDTSILEGRFQVNFPIRGVNSYVNAPDSMRLECGAFRVERF